MVDMREWWAGLSDPQWRRDWLDAWASGTVTDALIATLPPEHGPDAPKSDRWVYPAGGPIEHLAPGMGDFSEFPTLSQAFDSFLDERFDDD